MSQGFDGVLDITCIRGGPITQLEAEYMEQIMSEAQHDAAKSGIDCRYIVSEVSYFEFLSEYEELPHARASQRQQPNTTEAAHSASICAKSLAALSPGSA